MADDHPQTHEVDLWKNKDGDVLGAPVLLTPEEAMELQETGHVTITLKRHWKQDDDHG